MCSHHLGGLVDIHGGGADLIFPHHENEIAQSEAALGREPFARYWVHNGLLQFAGDKMSKSIGNVIRIKDLIDGGVADAFRLMVLQSHYRAPLTFSEDGLQGASRGVERLRTAAAAASGANNPGRDAEALREAATSARAAFDNAMNDDFDTPSAIAVLFDLARTVNRGKADGADLDAVEGARQTLVDLAAVLGLDLLTTTSAAGSDDADDYITLLVAIRDELRVAKQWALSDRIRDELSARGITIADAATGSTWKRSS